MESITPEKQLVIQNKVQSQHEAVFKAIEAQDAAAAEKAMHNHMSNFGEDLKPETESF